MGNKNPSPATRFKKGQSGNPQGARLHNPALRALRKLTIETYREVIELALTANIDELKKVAENPETPAVQVGIAVALVKALNKGDWQTLNSIAERIVGKVPENLNLTSTNVNISVEDRKQLSKWLADIESEF